VRGLRHGQINRDSISEMQKQKEKAVVSTAF
jgi:hypothetical protein